MSNSKGNAERHARMREEIGKDPERLAKRLSAVDRNAYDFSGFSDEDINLAFRGKDFLDEDYERLTGNRMAGSDDFKKKLEEAQKPDPANDIGDDSPIREEPTPPSFEAPLIPMPIIDDAPDFVFGGGEGSFNAGDITATIGKQGDMNTTIGDDNTFGANTSIGNDYSTTYGSQMFGNALSLPRRRMAEEGGFAGLRFN